MQAVLAANKREPKVWCPLSKKLKSWIEPGELKAQVGGGCTVM
jgi:hypothetical protein